MALSAATDADEAVRNRGVRLVANRLYGNQDVPELTAQVRAVATGNRYRQWSRLWTSEHKQAVR